MEGSRSEGEGKGRGSEEEDGSEEDEEEEDKPENMETLNDRVNETMVPRASLTNLFLSTLNAHITKNVETITRASSQHEEQRYGQDVSGQKEVETVSGCEKVETNQ